MNQNYVSARQYYLKAISNKIPETYLNLGFLYHYGLGIPVDDNKAFDYFDKAANKGIAQAQYHLGIHYRDGRAVNKNITVADYWFNKANANGLFSDKVKNENFALREPVDVHLYVHK